MASKAKCIGVSTSHDLCQPVCHYQYSAAHSGRERNGAESFRRRAARGIVYCAVHEIVTIQMKVSEQCFAVMLFIML